MAWHRGQHWRARATLSLIVAGLVVVAGAAAGCSSPRRASQAGPANPSQNDYERVIRQVLPSVVQIDAGRSTGSGVVFDARDYIVTNAHVVGKVKSVKVIASATSRPLTARVIGLFTPDDLAVIKVSRPNGTLTPVRWADSARAQVGQIVLAMGSPYGLIDSVTQGIISATDRTVAGPTISGEEPTVITSALQTSAAINPGNSGGALVALSGEVIGIPTLTARDPELGGQANGIGFAIPSNTVREIATQLINTGHVTRSDRASLQIIGKTHTDLAGSAAGVAVDLLKPDGAAAAAGIKVGDVILAINGIRTDTLGELDSVLIDYRPGQKAAVEVLVKGHKKQFHVELGSLSSGQS